MAGVERLSSAAYTERYKIWRSSHADSALIPSMGDSVVVIRDRLFGRTHQGTMAGWFRGGIVLGEAPGQEEWIQVAPILEILKGGQVILAQRKLQELLSEPSTPFVNDAVRVRLIVAMDTTRVAAEEISSLRVPAHNTPGEPAYSWA